MFTNTEEETVVQVSSCLDNFGEIQFSVTCNRQPLKPLAKTSFAPGGLSGGWQTEERNNLHVVGGDPSSYAPPLTWFDKYAVGFGYTATTTGKCWTGVPPYCA